MKTKVNKKKVLRKLMAVILVITLSVYAFIKEPGLVMVKAATESEALALITSFVPSVTGETVTSGGVSFTHPGIIMSKTMLNTMRDGVRNDKTPWISAFMEFCDEGQCSTSPLIRYDSTNSDMVNIPNGTASGSYANLLLRWMAQDADTAYAQTIMWYITGNEVYRTNAMNILRGWTKMRSIGNVYDEQIRVSLAVYKFCFAAEIMKYAASNTLSTAWTSGDTTSFLNFLTLLNGKYNRYTHFMNQHDMCCVATMNAAIFSNDADLYKKAVQRTTTNPELGSSDSDHATDGSIKYQIAEVSGNLQVIEMGRDQGHANIDIVMLATSAMTSYIQGTKVDPSTGGYSTASDAVYIFNFMDDRILKGANYLCRYNLGYDVTYNPCYFDSISTSDRGSLGVGLGQIYQFYKYYQPKSDLDTSEDSKYLSEAFYSVYPEGVHQDAVGSAVLLYSK